MFLIDKPFVSDFLIKTIKENHYDVISTKIAKELINDNSISWISEEKAIKIIEENSETPIYTNSENALAWFIDKPQTSKLFNQIQNFKDKIKFRKLIKSLFPNFFFKTIKLEDIQSLNLTDINFPFVIKPSIGFLSIGVHVVNNERDWDIAKNELTYDKLQSIFPSEVLDTSTFIIEDYIEGEEFAIDFYFNINGDAVILNILHHIFSSGTDTSDRVYSTSKDIILRYEDKFKNFLNLIGQKLDLRNFPAHAELRIDTNGQIIPIEINPLRFGGWCTTGDLLGIALNYNSYDYYHSNIKPNWDQIFRNKKNKKYSIIVLNNNSGFNPEEISHFDYNLLSQDFENPLKIRKLDIKKYPIFGFIFVETSIDKEDELNKILTSNLQKYICLE